MLTLQSILVAIVAIFIYRSVTAWQKSFNTLFKPTKLPADPPTKPGPSPAASYRGCTTSFINLVIMVAVVYWLFWLFSG